MLTILTIVIFSIIAAVMIIGGIIWEVIENGGSGIPLIVFGALIAIIFLVLGILVPLGQQNAAKGYQYQLASLNKTIEETEAMLSHNEGAKDMGAGIASAGEGVEIKQALNKLYADRNTLIQGVKRKMNGDNMWWIGYRITMPANFDKP
jgi:hypothetical protein